MKIAVTGTHSTGKTTLVKSISEKYGIPYVRGDKAVQICQNRFPGKPINELSVNEQWELQQMMYESFNDAFSGSGDCVTDGFHLTCIPYGIKYTDGKITTLPGYSDFIKDVIDKSNQFDHIFYLPPEIALENDNFRPQDQALRMDVDYMIHSLLSDFDFCTLSGTVDARTRKAGKEIGFIDKSWENYIVFEGLPRSGKSTQIRLLEKRAEQLGIPLYVCKRNNNDFIKTFKEKRKNNWYDNSREMLRLHSEAIKYDFQYNDIEDRVKSGQIVVSDRQKFTTMTLFGALGTPRHILYESVYDLPDPGRTIYLDANPVISVMRSIQTEPNKPLKMDLGFQEKVRQLYLKLARDHRFEIIQSNLGLTDVHNTLANKIFGDLQ